MMSMPSKEQVIFRECSIKLTDSIVKNNGKSCTVQEAEKRSLNFLETNKENIDLTCRKKGFLTGNFSDQSLKSISRFTCSHCQAVFSQEDHMNYHIKIVHKIDDSVPHHLSVNSNNENVSMTVKQSDYKLISKSEVCQGNIDECFNCTICPFVSASNKLLTEHLQVAHNVSKKQKCLECNKTFTYLKDFRTHVQSKHCHLLSFPCTKCPFIFISRTKMKNHFFKHHATSWEIYCHLCFTPFSKYFDVKMHFMTVHHLHGSHLKKALTINKESNKNLELIKEDSEYVIKDVKIIDKDIVPAPASLHYGNKLELENFDQASNNIKLEKDEPIIADQYERNSAEKVAATTDGTISYSCISFDKLANVYDCKRCFSTFLSKEESITHQNVVHAEINNHTCFDCDEFFPLTSLLRDHIDNMHKSLNMFTCDICQDSFFSKASVIAHLKKCMLNLKSIQQSYCEICSTVFVSRENLVQHIKSVHRKIKPFSCTDCGKSFYSRQKVQRHARAVHQKLKPYGCPECDKYFSTTGNRKQHLDAVHKNIRLYTCETCLLSFSNRASMKQHIMSVHMKLKPFKCKYCGAAFSLKIVCQQHEYSVHLKLKLYKCEKCLTTYGWQRSLSKHRCSAVINEAEQTSMNKTVYN